MSDSNLESPSKLLLGLEGLRAAGEYGLGLMLKSQLKSMAPPGDGHPVMVFPGLAGADGSTTVMRAFLKDLGYDVYGWGLGRNYGPRAGMDIMMADISERVIAVSEMSGKPVSVIGWSLGGVYAREISKMHPDYIRQCITLGTPFKPSAGGTNAAGLYEILSGDKSHKDPEVLKKISEPVPVPFTSIYSKTDGVVHWECSIEDQGQFDNIEVPASSHLGLGHNPVVLYLLAEKLRYTKDTWEKFKR